MTMRARASARRAFCLAIVMSLACGKSPSRPSEDEGGELFHNACARCHGPDGTGGPPDSFGNPGPKNFTEPAFQSATTDAKIVNTIENGNRGMPAFGAVLTPEQIKLLLAHVRKLGPAAAPSAAPAGDAR